MYYTLHARLKKTEPDYKSDLNLFQTDPVQHDSDQANSGQTNPASPVSTLNNPICIENGGIYSQLIKNYLLIDMVQ